MNTHRHNPCKQSNPFVRFFLYLLFPGKVYFVDDDSGICKQCNTPVKAPPAYYQLGLRISYAIFGFFAVLFWMEIVPSAFNINLIRIPIIFALTFAYNRIASAFVLTFFEWRPYNDKNDNIDQSAAYARKNGIVKWRYAAYGMAIAILILLLIYAIR